MCIQLVITCILLILYSLTHTQAEFRALPSKTEKKIYQETFILSYQTQFLLYYPSIHPSIHQKYICLSKNLSIYFSFEILSIYQYQLISLSRHTLCTCAIDINEITKLIRNLIIYLSTILQSPHLRQICDNVYLSILTGRGQSRENCLHQHQTFLVYNDFTVDC